MADGGSSNGEVVDEMRGLSLGGNVDNVASVGTENSAEDSRPDENASARETREKEIEKYTMSEGNRGVAIIFNHTTYMERNPKPKPEDKDQDQDQNQDKDKDKDKDKNYTLDDRTGTNDEDILKATFTNLGFDVHVCTNLTWTKIKQTLTPGKNVSGDTSIIKLRPEDLKRYHCIVVAVLTHGSSMGYLEAYDHGYHVTQLFKLLSDCKDLKGKPKLFFIQASKGKRTYGDGKKVDNDDHNCGQSEPFICAVPSHADFLISFEGQRLYDDNQEGSPCTSILCPLLDDYHTDMDLVTLLTIVNGEVGERFSTKSHCFTSTLTKRLYL